ncbi:MAG: acyltransferase family protein [Rhodomicrobium sp.]
MIVNLQYLRAFAAIIVVLEHIFYRAESYGQAPFYLQVLKGWGLSGVDIFFTISGFVMCYTQSVSKKSPLQFIEGRIIRIVPLYWFLTLSVVLLFLLFPAYFRTLHPKFDHAILSLLFLSQAVLGDTPFIDVGWTLEWEMFFYVVFAASLSVLSGQRQLLLISAVLLCPVLIFANHLFVLEFVLGAIAAQLFLNRRLERFGLVLFSIGFLLLIAGIFVDLNVDRLFAWGIPAFLIVLGAASTRQRRDRFLLFLGTASYSIYLVQVASIPVFYKLSSKLELNINRDILALVCLVTSVTIGCMLYLIVERPITAILKQWFPWRARRAGVLPAEQRSH